MLVDCCCLGFGFKLVLERRMIVLGALQLHRVAVGDFGGDGHHPGPAAMGSSPRTGPIGLVAELLVAGEGVVADLQLPAATEAHDVAVGLGGGLCCLLLFHIFFVNNFYEEELNFYYNSLWVTTFNV